MTTTVLLFYRFQLEHYDDHGSVFSRFQLEHCDDHGSVFDYVMFGEKKYCGNGELGSQDRAQTDTVWANKFCCKSVLLLIFPFLFFLN